MEAKADVEANTVRLSFTGDLDHEADASVSAVVEIPAGTRRVILDLQNVTFMNSGGISTLLRLGRRSDHVGARVELINVPPSALRVLRLTGVAAYFDLQPST